MVFTSQLNHTVEWHITFQGEGNIVTCVGF